MSKLWTPQERLYIVKVRLYFPGGYIEEVRQCDRVTDDRHLDEMMGALIENLLEEQNLELIGIEASVLPERKVDDDHSESQSEQTRDLKTID